MYKNIISILIDCYSGRANIFLMHNFLFLLEYDAKLLQIMIEWIATPGLIEYKMGLELMEQRLLDVINYKKSEAIFLFEHEDVYTAGTNYKPEELLSDNKFPIIYTGRGGKFTYHGPGQLVIYPILDLRKSNHERDIKKYVRKLESWIINSLVKLGINAYTIKGLVGIWANHKRDHAKIAAIGVRIKKWVTYHGIAVNISTDLERYSGIIPCGIDNFPVTSLYELGIGISQEEFISILKEEFKKLF